MRHRIQYESHDHAVQREIIIWFLSRVKKKKKSRIIVTDMSVSCNSQTGHNVDVPYTNLPERMKELIREDAKKN